MLAEDVRHLLGVEKVGFDLAGVAGICRKDISAKRDVIARFDEEFSFCRQEWENCRDKAEHRDESFSHKSKNAMIYSQWTPGLISLRHF